MVPTVASANALTPGDLDPTFGVAGEVATDFGGSDSASAVTIDSDGKIIAAGTTQDPSSCLPFPFDCRREIAIARYNDAGSLDTSFGLGGRVITDFGSDVDVRAVTTEGDGSIVVAGDVRLTTGRHAILVARYLHDGSPDDGFGSNGFVTTSVGIEAFGYGVAIESDGDIVVAGHVAYDTTGDFLIARYQTNGSLDSTFGSDGVAVVDFGVYSDAFAVAVEPGGAIVAVGDVGNSYPSFGLVRLTSNGSLDPTFGSNGQATTTSGAAAYSVALLPDGKLVVGGWGYYLGGEASTLARYQPDGTLDPTFGDNGVVVTNVGSGSAIYGVATQTDGKVVAVDQTSSAVTAVVRYNADGRLDQTFGVDGIVTTAYPSGGEAQALALQPDGAIVTAGYSGSDFEVVRYVGLVDTTAPTVTAAVDRQPNSDGWYNKPVTITFTCADALSGVATCPASVTINSDGADQIITGTAYDNAGNTASASLTVNVDQTAPVVGIPTFSIQPMAVSDTTGVTAAVSDALSGVVGGEIWIGTDPGIGQATPLVSSNGTLSGAISGLAAGLYPVGVRAVDAAGNWSASSTALLVVYDPNGGFATGGGWIIPGGATSETGDLLPGLDGTSKANFGFVVKYQNGQTTVPGGNFEFHYNAGDFHLSSTGFQWLVVTNTQWAHFQGQATINGGTTRYPIRIDARDSNKSGTPDHLVLRIYATGTDPNTATPIYQASGDVTGGDITIHNEVS